MQKHISVYVLAVILLTAVCAAAVETKDIKFAIKNATPVVFSHERHLLKYNNNCKMCHNAIYDLKAHRHFTMAEMEKTKSCGACHSGVKAFSVATEKDCAKCHKGKTQDKVYKVKGVSDAVFGHTFHVAKTGGACKSCHGGKIFSGKTRGVTMAEMEKGKTCGACHNGTKAFTVAGNCNRCHKGLKPREVTFTLKGAAPATFSHSFHTQAYSCKECHTRTFPYKAVSGKATMADMAQGKSCGVCHNGKDAFASSGDCGKCHKGMKPGKITFKTSAGEAVFSHEFHIQAFKCAECHTKIFPYKAVTGKATMADMANGKSCGACHDGKEAFASSGDCEKCHKGFKPRTITFKTDAGDATFSHDFHVQAYKCADCHTKVFPYKAVTGKATMADMEKGASCGTCHNKDKDAFSVKDDKFCAKCHKM
ncbi:c(7)-type cytochrome triheme domain-containing protein [Oryzomonas sagensis]|uniref:c(7)-type cytochrome triheme domain-containing protein n=1 Tax=Oryzomonas sagensis TaxID=2603857 RepID=UPI00177BDE70